MWTLVLEKDGWTKYALNLPSLCCWLRSLTFIWKTHEKLGKIVLRRKLSYKALVTWKRKIHADFFLYPRSPKTKWPQLSSVHVFCITVMGTLNACGIRTPCSKRTPLIFATSSLLSGKRSARLSVNVWQHEPEKLIVGIYPLELWFQILPSNLKRPPLWEFLKVIATIQLGCRNNYKRPWNI